MYTILDIETTGGKYNEEGITEIAIHKFDGHNVVDKFISLVNPEKDIQPFVVNLTGINNKMLRTAPKFHEVAKRIVEITEDSVLVAHNAQFDYRILRTEFRRLGYNFERKTLCTVDLSKNLLPDAESYSLGKLVRSLGIPMSERHRANGDAIATLKLFKLLLAKDMDKNFDATISGKLAAINKNLDALNKNLKSLNANLNQTKSTVKNLAGSKADKKSQDAAFAKVNAALKPLKKELKSLTGLRSELKTVSSEIKKMEGNFSRKLAEVATAVEQSQKDTAQLQTSITRLSDDKIDKDTFGLEAFKLKKSFHNLLSHEITAINQELDSIQKKIDDIQKMSKSPKRSLKSLSKKTSPTTDKAPAPSKSGSIDEQDLPE